MNLIFIYVNVRSLVLVQLRYVSSIGLYDECYNKSRNISTMGWVDDRAAVQAWEHIHFQVSGLFSFPPDAHGLTSNFLFVQLQFCFPAEDNLGGRWLQCGRTCLARLASPGNEAGLSVSSVCFVFRAFKMCFYIKYLKVCAYIHIYKIMCLYEHVSWIDLLWIRNSNYVFTNCLLHMPSIQFFQ